MIILFTFFLITSAFCQEPSLDNSFFVAISSSLLTEQVPVGDTAEIRIVAKFFDNPAYWLFDSMPPPMTMGLTFLGTATETHTHRTEDSLWGTTQITLRFSPKRTGQLTISPWQWQVFHLTNGDTTEIDTVSLSFGGYSLLGLPSKKGAGAMRLPFVLIASGLVLAIVATLLMRYFVRKSREEFGILSERTAQPKTPQEIAIMSLQRLSPQRMSTEKILDELSSTIRKFIADEFKIPAQSMPSEEILSTLSERGLAGHRFIALKSVFRYCDDVRFAEKYPEADEVAKVIEQGKIFITNADPSHNAPLQL